MPETIWSNSELGPAPSRRFSLTLGEIESSLFDYKRLLMPQAASTGAPRPKPQYLGTALISGGIASRHPHELFLAKFAAVADATRDVELAGQLGALQVRRSSRGSFSDLDAEPLRRTLRNQLILDKIDSYNASPIQAHVPADTQRNIWNPATATAFQPLSYFMDPFAPLMVPPQPVYPYKEPEPERSRKKKNKFHIHRSVLLEEVRANPKRDYALSDIAGHALEFTRDQHGLRFIQQRLPAALEPEKNLVFAEIRDSAYELMTDVFGNYVVQNFFEHGSPAQHEALLACMAGKVQPLLLQMYGCRVVQRALEYVPLRSQVRLVDELRSHILVCLRDQNGNHVVQKALERIPFEQVRHILDSLARHIHPLSTHPYGCRVIQRLLDFSTPADQAFIMGELHTHATQLIQDQYGNYVIQHVLERGAAHDKELIVQLVLQLVVAFSKHKFASNVVEKCIKHGSADQRRRLLHEVLLGNENPHRDVVEDELPLALMMKDQYANYVIQKLVEAFDAKSPEKRLLITKLRQYLRQLSARNAYGKHLALVEKMIAVAGISLEEH